MADTYRIRSIEAWAQARDAYLSGMSAETVCRRHDLGLSAFRRRARKYGWRRSDQVEPPPGETDLSIYEDVDMDEQVQTARLRFVAALEQGRATEAVRWRRLWLELRDEAHEADTDFFRGMSREEVRAFMDAEQRERDMEDEALQLGPACD